MLVVTAGGGVAVDRFNNNITFYRNFFSNNSAPVGGGLYLGGNNIGVELLENIFITNKALVDGGGFASDDSNRGVSLTGDVFDGNTCFWRGAGERERAAACLISAG